MIRKTIKLLLCALALMTSAGVRADVQRQAVYKGDVLLWRCQQLSEAGTYNDGLDYTLYFRTIDTTRVNEPVTLCEGDTLLWRCRQLWKEGVYVDTIPSVEFPDLDSVYYALNLKLAKAKEYEEDVTIFLGETLLWRCEEILADKVGEFKYRDTVVGGSPVCPTEIHVLTLTVKPMEVTNVVENVTICAGDTLLWHCQELFEASGDKPYGDTLKSVAYPNYDSVRYALNLKLAAAKEYKEETTILLGETLLWRCEEIRADEEGEFEYRDTVVGGTPVCPTEIHVLTLTVKPMEVTNVVENVTICAGDTLLWHCKQLFEASGENTPYRDTLKSIAYPAYDSVRYALNLKLATATPYPEEVTIMLGETLLWRCEEIVGKELGEFEYRDTVVGGTPVCPAEIHILTLNVAPMEVTNVVEDVTICAGDTLLWHCKQLFEASGENTPYRDTLKSIAYPAYDSVRYALNLKLAAAKEYEEEATILLGETLLWRCEEIYADKTGKFEYRDTVVGGTPVCPTEIHVLTLNVDCMEKKAVNDTIVYCGHDTVLWRCEQLTKSGDYTDTVWSKAVQNCDSVVYSLHLIYHKDTVAASWDTIYVHKEDFNPTYSLKGKVDCDSPGEYVYWEKFTLTDYEDAHGLEACDSIQHRVRLVLRDSVDGYTCNGDTMLWRCITADHTEVYGDTVKAIGAVSGEETITELHYLDFHFHAVPYDSIKYDTISVESEKYPYVWRTGELTQSGEYHDTAYYENSQCIETLYTLYLKVEPVKKDTQDVTLCKGDTLLWRCQQVYVAGEYRDTLRYPSGNDSIRYTLNLTVQKDSVTPVLVKYLKPGETFVWDGDGKPYGVDKAGEHELQTQYASGCDSILFRMQIIRYDSAGMESCNGEKVLWRCHEMDESKLYSDTVFGDAPSIFTGEKFVKELYLMQFDFHAAPYDSIKHDTISSDSLPYIWRHTTKEGEVLPIELNETGEYHDTTYYANSACRDSLFTLYLKVEPVKKDTQDVTLCKGDTLLWRCQQVYVAGEYRDTLRYPSGNDSICYTLNLTVQKDSVTPVLVKYLKPNEKFTWEGDGEQYSADDAGEYEHPTYYTNTHCDSILFRMQIIRYDSAGMESCNGEKVLWRCHEMDESKLYSDTVFGAAPSIFTGEKFVKELYLMQFDFHAAPYDSIKHDTISVESEKYPYVWRTGELTESGEYHDTAYYENSQCIETLYTLYLKVEPVKKDTQDVTLCKGDTLLWRCQQVYVAGEYRDTLRYPSGNDSIRYTLNLTVQKDSVTPVLVKYLKPNEKFTWEGDGKPYGVDKAGEHELQTQYASGCDSILFRMQIIRYDSAGMESCNGEKVLWRCHEMDESKLYSDTVFGDAPSIFTGEKFVKELYLMQFDFHAAPYDSIKHDTISSNSLPYIWRHTTKEGEVLPIELNETGEYHDTAYYENSACMDSLFTLYLKVEKIDSVITYDTLCMGDTLLWRCMLLDSTDVYYDTIHYASGNDSIRYEMHLTVYKSSIAPIDTVIICNNDPLPDLTEWEPVDGDGYNYERQTYYERTTHQLEDEHGCDSVLYRMMLIERKPVEIETTDTICVPTMTDTVHYIWTSWRSDTVVIPAGLAWEEELPAFTDVKPYSDSLACDSARYTHKVVVRRLREMPETKDIICGDLPDKYAWKLPESGGDVQYVEFTEAERKQTGQYPITREYTKYFRPTSWQTVGCDSAHFTLTLSVYKPINTEDNPTVVDTTVCYSDVFHWDKFDKDYAVAGTYDTVLYYPGTECIKEYCRLELKHYALPDTSSDALTQCENAKPYIWHGQTITSGGVYWDSTFYEGTQCVKRYFKLDVEMLTAVRDTVYNSFCEGGTFVWSGHFNDRALSKPGWYYDTVPYQVLKDCDSLIHTLYLKEIVLDSIMPADTAYICNGQTYIWHINGKSLTFDSTGVYRDTVQSRQGCDSVYNILVLEKQPPMSKHDTTLYICDGVPVTWDYNGKTYYHATMTYDTIRSEYGCDITVWELHVEEHNKILVNEDTTIYETQTYKWRDGEEYSKEGTYYYEVYYKNSGCVDTLYTLNLKVEPIRTIPVDVRDTVCAGDSVYGRVITEHTEWTVTKQHVVDESGALVDSVINYYIGVYDFDLPKGILDRVHVSCGMPVMLGGASDIIDDYIDNNENYAPNAEQKWTISENGGAWQDLDTTVALDGKDTVVVIRCTVTSDCEPAQVIERTYPVSLTSYMWKYTLYDFLPVISKYNGTMLMVDADAVADKLGWKPKAEDVQWYKQDGALDNWEDPDPNDPRDIAMNKWGFYYTPEQATVKNSTYYALIKYDKPLESGNVCGMLARTVTIEGNSPITLNPTAANTAQTISIGGDGPYLVKVIDMFNMTVYESPASGVNSFRAPSLSGTYIVQVSDLGGRPLAYRTLIVY